MPMRALHYVSMATGNFRLFVTFGGASNLVVDSGSHKLQHYLNAISLKIETSLLTTVEYLALEISSWKSRHWILPQFPNGYWKLD